MSMEFAVQQNVVCYHGWNIWDQSLGSGLESFVEEQKQCKGIENVF